MANRILENSNVEITKYILEQPMHQRKNNKEKQKTSWTNENISNPWDAGKVALEEYLQNRKFV